MPPAFSGAIVFAFAIAIVIAAHISSMHLLWLFPLSHVVGALLLIFPPSAKLLMFCLCFIGNFAENKPAGTQPISKNKTRNKKKRDRTKRPM